MQLRLCADWDIHFYGNLKYDVIRIIGKVRDVVDDLGQGNSMICLGMGKTELSIVPQRCGGILTISTSAPKTSQARGAAQLRCVSTHMSIVIE
jgi:hypothetical protein